MEESISAVKAIENLLQQAHEMRASDVHLDPGEGALFTRLRIDGILHDSSTLPLSLHHELIARLKILAGLRIDEHQIPQDGRFRFDIQPTEGIDVRVSIAPTYHGENAVLRILSSIHMLSSLTALGFSSAHQAMLHRALQRPYGMILITGPTGSGKTSTLYALIQILNTRAISIVTIEDPIEYALAGINQIPANHHTGLSFAAGLKSILRQDPNVIGIGEIRDTETAALATNAALTGHLVISTLHTTDAPTALPRLIDMGIEPYLVSSTISIVVNQRLVRRLCPQCKKKKPLRKEQRALVSLIPGPRIVCSEQYESAGCDACSGTGTAGRIGIFEIMTTDTMLREAASRKASSRELYALAVSQGMMPLLHDGIRKVTEGSVALDDVLALMSE